jgi:hypothetical protein
MGSRYINVFGTPLISPKQSSQNHTLSFGSNWAVIDEIQQEEKLWQPRKKKADQLPPMDDASKDASKDASTQTHKSQTSPQAGSETTARADASGSGGARVAGGRTSVGAPRTFY